MNNIEISIVIITLGRETIYRTLETICAQHIEHGFEIILILQGEVDEARIGTINKDDIPIRIKKYPHGLGFGKYRNIGIKHSEGEVIAFIDDDEWAKDYNWLTRLTEPIFNQEYFVTTSGYDVPLTGNYITDCISLLGFPGGGALGFEKMWPVDDKNETDHICSGNFAFHKRTGLSFNDELKFGAEDADFGNRIVQKGYRIKYIKEATVFHIPRTGIINFINWHVRRGISIYEFNKLGLLNKKTIRFRKRAAINIFNHSIATKYIFGVTLIFILQYIASILGYWQAMRRRTLMINYKI